MQIIQSRYSSQRQQMSSSAAKMDWRATQQSPPPLHMRESRKFVPLPQSRFGTSPLSFRANLSIFGASSGRSFMSMRKERRASVPPSYSPAFRWRDTERGRLPKLLPFISPFRDGQLCQRRAAANTSFA